MAPQALSPTTLFVSATFAVPTTDALAGVGTATDTATNALPTQLVYDSSAARNPLGPATTSLPPTSEPANSKVQSSPTAATDPNRTASAEPNTSSHNDLPVAAIIMAIIAAGAIAALLFFLWYRKRARRRGHVHSRADSHDMRGPPAGDVLRKLGPATYEKSDPFSDTNAVSVPVDPFADPEKGEARHDRSGSDSFLSMGVPRQPYTHAASASTGSSASSKMRKREMDDEREKDMMALNNLVRALDQKERKAEQEGRDRKSLPPIELFKAALVR